MIVVVLISSPDTANEPSTVCHIDAANVIKIDVRISHRLIVSWMRRSEKMIGQSGMWHKLTKILLVYFVFGVSVDFRIARNGASISQPCEDRKNKIKWPTTTLSKGRKWSWPNDNCNCNHETKYAIFTCQAQNSTRQVCWGHECMNLNEENHTWLSVDRNNWIPVWCYHLAA